MIMSGQLPMHGLPGMPAGGPQGAQVNQISGQAIGGQFGNMDPNLVLLQ